jgi:hypothetical protein
MIATPRSPRSLIRRRFAVIAALTAFGLGACNDASNPAASFDPTDASQATNAVLSVFAANPALDALGVLESALPGFTPPPAPPAGDLPLPAGSGLADLRVLDRLFSFPSPSESAVLFPADLLGATLVYNPATGQYEVDPAATGAPANGIRLVLYAVDPVFHSPVEPLSAVGHLDLTDESTAAADQVGILAVLGDVTYIDYHGSATVLTDGVTFAALGYFSDGTTVVNFDLSQSWSSVDGFVLAYDVNAHAVDTPTAVTSILAEVHLDPSMETASYALAVEHQGESVSLAVTGSATSLNGTVSHNGVTVAEVSGDPDNPVFTDGNGHPLTNEQIQALGLLFGSITAIISGFDVLLIPAYLVLQVTLAMV